MSGIEDDKLVAGIFQSLGLATDLRR